MIHCLEIVVDPALAPTQDSPRMRFALAISIALASWSSIAQSPPASTSREIAALFSALERSHCQFNRNGSWYDAAQASAHLHQKYEYLLRKQRVATTESFIDLAASRSSLSGRSYLVRCADQKVTTSNAWFMAQLMRLRGRS
jgi:hypothetical protein